MIAIKNSETGEIQYVETLEGYDGSWQQHGPALPADVNPQFAIIVDGGWVDDPLAVGEDLKRDIKKEAETRKMASITQGWAKTQEYQDKGAEIAAAAALTNEEIDALSAQQKVEMFPSASIESALSGEAISTILDRYRAGAAASMPELRRLSAIEQHFCRLIDNAEGAEAKRVASQSVDWGWQPPAAGDA